jgi:CRP-like cAMP-binding protein
LIYKIKEVPYGGDEVIYTKGEKNSNSLYYLLKGSVLLTYPSSRYTKTIEFNPEKHNPNDQSPSDFLFFNFGVREFFTRETRDQNAITQSYSKIQKLDY